MRNRSSAGAWDNMYGTNRAHSFSVRVTGFLVSLGLLGLSALTLMAQEADDLDRVPAPPVVEKAAEKKAETKKADDAKAGQAKAEKADKGEKVKTEEKAEAKKEPEKAPVNPLNNLIRGIFGGAKPQGRIIPNNPPAEKKENVKEPANGDKYAQDRIDARAPYDPSVAKLIRQIDSYMEEARAGDTEKWNLALNRIEYLLDPERKGKDQPVEDALVRGAKGEWTTMRREANRLLSQFPPDRLAFYRQENGGLAADMLRKAKDNGNINQIVTVATQFFHTPAGSDAANWMAMRHFDHGEFGMAARWFRQLLDHEAPVTSDPSWLLKAAVTFHQAGDKEATKKLLEQLEEAPLRFRDKTLKPQDFLAKLTQDTQEVPELDDWRMLLGSPSHVGKAQGGDPLLLSRWFQPLSNSHKANEMIEEIMGDLVDQQYAPVPHFTPIMVDGKAIFRTLRGVRVTDVDSGRTLWETRGGITPESLITGVQNTQPEYMQQIGVFGGESYYPSGNVNNQRLISLLFKNGTWGGLSSDGEQLFVLEDHAVLLPYDPGNHWAFQNGINDTHRRDYSTNKIVSYNLKTGRPRWEIGGTAMDEPFDRRLAGQYFFGVPVADEGELFAIGERDNEIRMFSLDRETGRPIWSQLVAYSDARIEQDFGRRWWNAQVGVGQGVIVCPTTVGWLVGIDRLNRSVLWAYRYSKPQKESDHNRFSNNNQNLVQNHPLNAVWGPSAPVIIGHRVVFTPPEVNPQTPAEHNVMVCLDLFTGKLLWSKQKEDHLYLAGVFDGKCLLVGKSKISAISLESGSTLWDLSLSEEDGKPSGMGVAVGDVYHLPMTSRELWTLDLSQGKVTAKAELPDGLPLLGNLGMYRGMLLSLGADGMTAFSQKQAIEQEILARRQKDPGDAWAMLFDANIHTLQGNYDPALERLRQVKPEKLTAELQTRYRELMVESLAAVIRAEFQKRDAEYTELRDFVQSDDEQLTFRRLTADRLKARGDYQSAFDEYLMLAESRGEQLIERDDDPRVTLSLDRWLTGRFEQLWRDVSGDDRARLDERIAAAGAAVQSQSTEASQRFLVHFGFHPEAIDVRRALVEEFALSGDVALAQNQLIKLSRNSDERVAAQALERMARLFRDRGLKRDANYYYQQLADRYPKVPLEDGTLASVRLEELKASGQVGPVAGEAVSWSDAKIEHHRTGTSYSYYGSQDHDLQYTPYRLPYLQDRRFQFFQNHQRLGVVKAATDELEWLVPLRRGVSGSQGNLMPSDTSGHVIFVVHAGILHALSPIDRKILWTRPLDPKGTQNVYYSSNQNTSQPMQRDDQFRPLDWLQRDGQQRGSLVVVNSDFVCVLGRRELTVHDAVTGRVRWSKDRLPMQSKIYGTDSLVFIVPQDSRKTLAYSAIDGRPMDVPNIGALLQKSMRVLPQGLVIAESKAANSILGLTRGTTELRFFDPLENRDLWTHKYPAGTYFSLMDDNYLAALRPSGELDLLDLETGKLGQMQGVTEDELKSKTEVRAIADHEHVYLIVNKKRQGNRFFSYYDDGNMPSIPVNGRIFAWNRETGKFLWKQDVENQKLMLMHFTHAPLLVFNTQIYKQLKNFSYSAMNTLVIDKTTGKIQVDVSAPSNYSNFRIYQLNLGQRMMELRSYQMRLRITALPPGTAEENGKHPAPAVAE